MFSHIAPEKGLAEKAADELERLILNGELKENEKLTPERELAEAFGVSRTVIREAIRILQTRGLLVIRPGIGSIVQHPGIDQFAEGLSRLILTKSMGVQFSFDSVNEARIQLEAIIIKMACERATAEDLRRTWEVIHDLESLASFPAKFFEHAVDYHGSLALATHNPLLIIVFDAIQEVIYRIRRILLPEPIPQDQALAAFRQITCAIETNDPDQAIETMKSHYAIVWQKLSESLARLDLNGSDAVTRLPR